MMISDETARKQICPHIRYCINESGVIQDGERRGLEKARELVQDNYLTDPDEGSSIDEAYNRALGDIERAICKALLAAAPEPPVSAEPTQQQLDAAWARVAPLVGCDPTSAADPVPSGWRDISTAPKRDRKKRTDVLLGSFPKGAIAVGEAHRPPRDCFTTMDGTYHAPTHWQPLPAAPKGRDE